jgi:hypothetical protein
MTATTTGRVDAYAGAQQTTAGSTGASMRLLPGRLVAYAWLLAAIPIAVLQVVHSGLHERNEPPPILHWLRDSAFAVPAAGVAVIVAALLVSRLRPAERGERASLATTALWACLTAVLFALLSLPGHELHAELFGAEEEVGVSLLQDLVGDGVYALEAALLILVPLALLAGMPWQGAWRATSPPDSTDLAPGPSRAGTGEPTPSVTDERPTLAGGAR